MRAKEYFELIDKKDFQYIEETKQALDDLYKLRLDYPATKRYLHNNLDAEYSMQPDKYQPIRKQLREIVQHDKTFSFFHAESSFYEDAPIINSYLSKEEVEKIIELYKENYDKESIDEYIKDSVCKTFYTQNQHADLSKENWLEVFKTALFLFDELRVKMYKTASTNEYLKQYSFENKGIREYIIKLIYNLLKDYEYDLTAEQVSQKELLIDLLEQGFINNPKAFEEKQASNIHLSGKQGDKADYLRIINAMYECGLFKDENGNKPLKKDVFTSFCNLVNYFPDNPMNNLSMANKSSNNDDNSQMTAIFDDLKKATIEFAKKQKKNEKK